MLVRYGRLLHHLRPSRPALCSAAPRTIIPPLALPLINSRFSTSSPSPPLPRLVRLYLQLIDQRPLLTKSVTAATILFLADLTSQGISISQSNEAHAAKWDVGRTLRMVAAGLFLSGPSLHLWFNLMSRTFPKRDIGSILKKMALGQAIYGPTYTVSFFSLNAFAQGELVDEVISRLKRDFFPTFKSGLMYWPLCDFLTYRYVPVHLQPLANNCFAYVWTIYFTYMASLKKVVFTPPIEME